LEYLHHHLEARFGELNQRGAKARFAAASGLDPGSIHRYVNGHKTPDIATCRRIAQAIGRPVLEVVVAAGHLNVDEVEMRDVPPLSPELERLRQLRTNSKLDAHTRARLDRLLGDVAEIIERPDRTG
jgi:transcriptional regulator with XRE-family HTH domain